MEQIIGILREQEVGAAAADSAVRPIQDCRRPAVGERDALHAARSIAPVEWNIFI